MPTALPPPRLRADVLLLAACLAVAGIASVLVRQDANWDLQNYHLYDPWAWVSGRLFGTDLAAAQLQTFHNPLLDLPLYGMVAWNWPPRAIAFALGLPAGVAAFFLVLVLRCLFVDLPDVTRRVGIASAFAIGVTGAMGRGTLGTTMNEWPIAALTMAALWLPLRRIVRAPDRSVDATSLVIAGVLLGIATGGKLTAGTFAVALCAALVLRGPWTRESTLARVREAFVFGCGVLAGFALTYGPWGYLLWKHYASPIFPYGNEWIRSPWWGDVQVIGRRFGPHNLLAWLRFPFDLYAPEPGFVSEVRYRDPRMPFVYGLSIAAACIWWWVRRAGGGVMALPTHAGTSRAWRLVVAFFVMAFLLWTVQHSNYRYLVALDLLSGALIVTLLERNVRPAHAVPIFIAMAVLVIALTQRGNWGRVDYAGQWIELKAPKLAPDALVVMATDAPMAHVIPFLDPVPARVVGIDNGIVNAEHASRLEDAVNRALRAHDGPMYALSHAGNDGNAALAARGLRKVPSTCGIVQSNLMEDPLTLCRVVRLSDGMPPR